MLINILIIGFASLLLYSFHGTEAIVFVDYLSFFMISLGVFFFFWNNCWFA